jgi:CHASE2 domain-containing sensor protein/tRNA A-37 threonylcarbamoyl transferase component Bud32
VKGYKGHIPTNHPGVAPKNVVKQFSGLILYVLITILVISLWAGRYGFLEKLATQMQDGMFKLRGEIEPHPTDVIVVGIDDRSIDDLGKWPWPRDLLAGLVFGISRGSPKVIGLDLFLPEQVEEDTSGRTDILAYEVAMAGNVVLSIYFNYSDVGMVPKPAPSPVLRSAIGDERNLQKGIFSIACARQIFVPDPNLVGAAHSFGHINIDYDKDGLVREEPLLVNYDGYLYASLGLQLASMYLTGKSARAEPRRDKRLKVDKTDVPTLRDQRMLLNYQGPNFSFERIPAREILEGRFDPAVFKDKVVLIGLTSTESKTWVDIPAFGKINEVERIATVTENIIHRNFLSRFSQLGSLLILVVIGIFCALVLPNVSLTYRFVILTVFLFVTFNLSYFLFSSFGIVTKPLYPILELLFFMIAAPTIKSREVKKKETKASTLRIMGEEESDVPVAADQVDMESHRKKYRQPAQVDKMQTVDDATDHFIAKEKELKENKVEEPEASKPEADMPPERTVELSEIPSPPVPSDESPTPTPSTGVQSVSQFGRYKVIETIGRGGMGMVYKGVDPILDRPVALKTIKLDFALSPAEIKELKDRLIREAKAAGKLSHPNIVTIYDVGEQEGLYYIAMEYLSGYTLNEFIKKKGELNYRIVAKIIIQTCEAISYAHSHGIVHRDIKPANIMLLDDFHVKVMDFGIARLDTTSLTQSNVALGIPHYISPEQLEGKTADKRSDIFSLGVVIYEFLTKQKTFQGENISTLMYRILNHNPVAPSSINDKIPLVFDHIVAKSMAKKPEERYQDAEEISKVLREFVSSFVVSRNTSI